MSPRMWATVGNIYKISAVFGIIGLTFLGYGLIDAVQHGTRKELIPPLAILTAVGFAFCVLCWNIKGPLIRGNTIARVIFGGWILLSIVASFGINLIYFGVVYLFTSEPAAYDYYGFRGHKEEPKPRFKAPVGWRATGRVGPSGATLYVEPGQPDASGIFDSFTPVQVVDKRLGYAQVVAETGQRGWIDVRVLTEGA